MPEINSFPINTKTFEELDPITDAQATDADGVMFFDESVGVMKRITRGELFKGKVIPIDSIADFPSLDTDSYSDRQQFSLGSFAPDGESGGGIMLWEPDLPKSLHDGVNYFSPTVPIPADFDNPTDVQNYLDGVGEEWPAGYGIFVLNYALSLAEFESLEDRVSQSETDITALDVRVTTAEADIVSLDNREFNTPAQAALASLPVGAKYSTKGAVTVGDGGHGIFIQSATAPTAVDGFSCFESANGTFGVLQQPYNVLQFGAKGDCTGVGLGTNDSAAIQRALTWFVSKDFQKLTFPAGYRFRLSSAVTANSTGRKGMHIEMLSPITPDATAFTAMAFSGYRDSEFKLYVEGGGTDANYMQASPVGGSQAFSFNGSRRIRLDITGHSYAGRVLRTLASTTPYKLSFLSIRLECGDTTGSPGSTPCGQACYIQGTTAFGGFHYINTVWTKYAPYFDDVVDVVVSHAELGIGIGVLSSWTWNNCGSVWLGVMLHGDESGTQVAMSFINNCRRVHINTFLSVNPLIAIMIKDSNATSESIKIDNLVTIDCQQAGLVIDNSKGVTANITSSSDVRAVEVINGSYNLDLDIKAGGSKKEALYIDSTIYDTRVVLNSTDASQLAFESYAHAKVESTLTGIVFNNVNTRGSTPSASFDFAASNNVRILGGRLSTQPSFLSNEPRIVRNCEGATSENKGTATILSGATSVIVNHGLYGAPDNIHCEGTTPDTASTYTNSESSTQFTINVPSAVGGGRLVKWSASRKAF